MAKAPKTKGKCTLRTARRTAKGRSVALVTREDNNSVYVVTEAGIALARELAKGGHPLYGIAAELGIGRAALKDARKRQPELQDAIDAGYAALEQELVHCLLAAARKGQYACAMFLLKTRCGYRENGPTPDAPAGPVINLNLPAPMDVAAYMRLVSSGDQPQPSGPAAIEHSPAPPPGTVNRG